MVKAPYQLHKQGEKPISAFDAALGFQQIARLAAELEGIKSAYEAKLKEVDTRIQEAHTNQKKELSGLKIKFHSDAVSLVDQHTKDILGARLGEIEMYLKKLNATITEVQKMQKGDKGDSIVGPPGKNAPIVDEEKLIKQILKKIPLPKNGVDGSIDIPKFMDMVIEKLTKDKTLKPEHIFGLKDEMTAYRNQLAGKHYGSDTLVRGGGDTVAAGSNISISVVNGVKTISSTGGSSSAWSTPVEAVNGSTTVFTVGSSAPTDVVADGILLYPNLGYTYSNPTITLTNAPSLYVRFR